MEEKIREVEAIKNAIMIGNYDENLKNQAIQLIGQYLLLDRVKLRKKGIDVGKPRNLLFKIVDKICDKQDRNNPIKK